VLRVFAGPDGQGGNPLGVVLDGAAVPADERQGIATELGFSETVFVDAPENGEVSIFTPTTELPFAGHPLVGAAWLLAREGHELAELRVEAGKVPIRHDGDVTWIAGQPKWAGPYEYQEVDSPDMVDALAGPPAGRDMVSVWAWEDEPAGRLRARVFPVAIGIEEDEATGAAAVRMGALLHRDLEIRQGRGSLLHVRPRGDGMVEVGGRVVQDQVRPLPATS
jgi:predicted PhzF superfamily epimerase YddE/YHI9